MDGKVFTFWEGQMPGYIQLCMKTWKFDYVLLNYSNLHEYTNLKLTDRLRSFSLPKIADVIRVHVLRNHGGYWLDTDTIMISDELPKSNFMGYPDTREHTIGFLHTEPHADMYRAWAKYQDSILSHSHTEHDGCWNVFGNMFTDPYVQVHSGITISHIEPCWPETYMRCAGRSRHSKYVDLYFNNKYNLSNFHPTDMLMLHNSWTPDWYKRLSADDVLRKDCTLSNILREILK